MDVRKIAITKIMVPAHHRKVKPAMVKSLAASILEVGLLQPIGLTKEHRLVYGRHRMEAYRSLGHAKIECVILPHDDADHADLAEIDENIQRHQLTALQEGQALKRRKAIYERLHPETKRGGGAEGVRGKPKRQNVALESFTQDTAAKTGKSRRTVERQVAVANRLPEKVQKQIADTPLAEKQSELEKLAALPAKEQSQVVKKVVSGEAKSVSQATGKAQAQSFRCPLNVPKAAEAIKRNFSRIQIRKLVTLLEG